MAVSARSKQRVMTFLCIGLCLAGLVALAVTRPAPATWADVETLLADHCVPYTLDGEGVDTRDLDVELSIDDEVYFFDRRTSLSLVVENGTCLVTDVHGILEDGTRQIAVENAIVFGLDVLPGSEAEDLSSASGWDLKVFVGDLRARNAHPSFMIYQVDAGSEDNADRATVFRFDRAEQGGIDA